ncbi:hypothetical protein [Planctomycetes bacterium Pla163]|uniref:hypothetical protein n=1 Tax=Rohdeia mirabilis TaxID=2528008 RepID=UPI0011A3C826
MNTSTRSRSVRTAATAALIGLALTSCGSVDAPIDEQDAPAPEYVEASGGSLDWRGFGHRFDEEFSATIFVWWDESPLDPDVDVFLLALHHHWHAPATAPADEGADELDLEHSIALAFRPTAIRMTSPLEMLIAGVDTAGSTLIEHWTWNAPRIDTVLDERHQVVARRIVPATPLSRTRLYQDGVEGSMPAPQCLSLMYRADGRRVCLARSSVDGTVREVPLRPASKGLSTIAFAPRDVPDDTDTQRFGLLRSLLAPRTRIALIDRHVDAPATGDVTVELYPLHTSVHEEYAFARIVDRGGDGTWDEWSVRTVEQELELESGGDD